MFTQSNYGICTKMGFWLMPKPPVFKPFEIQYENEADIGEIVELLRPLRIAQIIPNAVVIAGVLWEASTCNTRRADYITTPGHTPHARRQTPDARRHPQANPEGQALGRLERLRRALWLSRAG